MILSVDVGNSNIVLGLHRGRRLTKIWRIPTSRKDLDRFSKSFKHRPTAVVIASVVPPLRKNLEAFGRKILGRPPLFVTQHLHMPIRIRLKRPEEVGADRIVNAVAAYVTYAHKGRVVHTTRPLLIIDFGTATTFDVVTAKGDYIGGAIAPGLGIARNALATRCAKLPRIALIKPARTIGRDTLQAMRSGLVLGYASLVEGMIGRIRKEMKTTPLVVATGGLAPLISAGLRSIDRIEPNLTLEGLRLLYELNR